MNDRPGIILKKPVPLGQRDIDINWPNVYAGTTKALLNLVFQKPGVALLSLVDIGAAIGITQEPGEIAWLLIYSALRQAMDKVIVKNQDLLQKASQRKEVKEDTIQKDSENRLNQFLEKLATEEITITIYKDFFARPQDCEVIAEIKDYFDEWLKEEFNLNPAQVETISNCLPSKFEYALYSEYDQHSDKYAKLQTALNSNPFGEAVEKQAKKELSWRRYSAWLQKQVEEKMLLEPFGLKQVYVPLRAFYEEKIESEDDNFGEFERKNQRVDKNVKRYVVNLQDELQTWLDKADKTDALRVISGGPGSGKSSFAKMFAATLAESGKIAVLFISLHWFDLNENNNLIDDIDRFINLIEFIPWPANPLKKENLVHDKLLIIFDGLDELAMQTKMPEIVAQNFIQKVIRQVEIFNHGKNSLMVLIGGREILVQKNQGVFNKPKQILHFLPYFVDEEEIKNRNFIDTNKLLEEDQRQIWWEYYGKAKGCGYSKLPNELDIPNLREITAQPLLNYLVALIYEDNTLKLTENGNLNEIYARLISKVYQRDWADNKNPHIQGMEEKDFVDILEIIAISAWNGGEIRVTNLSAVKKYCDNQIIDKILNIFGKYKKDEDEYKTANFTRLLTAFYFRQYAFKNLENTFEDTFEFTHKSFGEYLAAKGIVSKLQKIHENLQKNKQDCKLGWNTEKALEEWAKICGLTAMDEYIFKFIVDEIRLQKDNDKNDKVDIGAWQQTMCDLISYMLKYGMPMEEMEIFKISTFQEVNRQARNAEEALLAVLNACARVTKKVSQIKWHSSVIENKYGEEKEYFTDFGNWISRLRGQRVNNDDVFCLNCLSFLDLQNCILTFQDFYKANLQWANLQEANLQWANLQEANLQWANLQKAHLLWANLQWGNFQEANLQWADLQWANLKRANLKWAKLEDANVVGTILEGNRLSR
jgi:uncharacterized protein YjbI with pentapeptide repeats